MRKRAVTGLAAALLLAGCAEPQAPEYVEQVWQVAAVYTEESAPTAVPESSAGVARVVFGYSSMTVDTGCRQLSARVRYPTVGAGAEPTTAVIAQLEAVADPAPCTGVQEILDGQLREVLQGEVTLRRGADYLLTITGQDAARVELVANTTAAQ